MQQEQAEKVLVQAVQLSTTTKIIKGFNVLMREWLKNNNEKFSTFGFGPPIDSIEKSKVIFLKN